MDSASLLKRSCDRRQSSRHFSPAPASTKRPRITERSECRCAGPVVLYRPKRFLGFLRRVAPPDTHAPLFVVAVALLSGARRWRVPSQRKQAIASGIEDIFKGMSKHRNTHIRACAAIRPSPSPRMSRSDAGGLPLADYCGRWCCRVIQAGQADSHRAEYRLLLA